MRTGVLFRSLRHRSRNVWTRWPRRMTSTPGTRRAEAAILMRRCPSSQTRRGQHLIKTEERYWFRVFFWHIRKLETYFLQKRFTIYNHKPEMILKEDTGELRQELVKYMLQQNIRLRLWSYFSNEKMNWSGNIMINWASGRKCWLMPKSTLRLQLPGPAPQSRAPPWPCRAREDRRRTAASCRVSRVSHELLIRFTNQGNNYSRMPGQSRSYDSPGGQQNLQVNNF